MTNRIQSVHQIFGPLDEFGLIVGLERLPGEDNASFRERILTYKKLAPSSTKQGLVNAISKELALEPYNVQEKRFFWLKHRPEIGMPLTIYVDGVEDTRRVYDVFPSPDGWPVVEATGGVFGTATDGWVIWRDIDGSYTQLLEFIAPPDGDFVSAEYTYKIGEEAHFILDKDETLDEMDPIFGWPGYWKVYAPETPDPTSQVVINALNDPAYIATIVDDAGLPTDFLRAITTAIRDVAPITWGAFTWDEGYYQDDADTFETLPSIFDASVAAYQDADFQGGVGGSDQLLLVQVTPTGTVALHPTALIF